MRFRDEVASAAGAGPGNGMTVPLPAADLGGGDNRGKHDNGAGGIPPCPADARATREVVLKEYRAQSTAGPARDLLGTVDDATGARLSLRSEQPSWPTGQVTSVDGGHVVRL